jgi:hypothetical protein
MVGLSGAMVSLGYTVERYYNMASDVWRGRFATVPSPEVISPFFVGARLTSLERSNNFETVWGFGAREATNIVPKQFSGSFSVEGILSVPWIFIPILGACSVSGSGSAYTYSIRPANGPSSITVENYVDMNANLGTGVGAVGHFRYLGCVCNSCSINASVNELVTIKTDWSYGQEFYQNTDTIILEVPIGKVELQEAEDYSQVLQNEYDYSPYTFASGKLTWNYNGTVTPLGEVQSCEITINPNLDLVYGLGTRMASSAAAKNIEYDINITALFEDPRNLLEYFYSGSYIDKTSTTQLTPANPCINEVKVDLLFDNVGCIVNGTLIVNSSTAGYKSIKLTFEGVKISTHSLPQSPTEIIVETISCKARELIVTCQTGTTAPSLPTA